jgi:hypothetical protein
VPLPVHIVISRRNPVAVVHRAIVPFLDSLVWVPGG